jgi:hypothetical protein
MGLCLPKPAEYFTIRINARKTKCFREMVQKDTVKSEGKV